MAEGAASAAVKAALDLTSTPEARQSATSFLDALKWGDLRVLGATAFDLCNQNQPVEVRHYGLKLLQHLVRVRWDELEVQEKQKFTSMVLEMINEFAKPYEEWSIKSQTSALAAEVARREGPDVWKVPLLNVSSISPVHAEMVVMVLRWLPEDVIMHNEDLESARRRKLLLELTESLPELLPFMFKMLETHYGAGIAQREQPELAKQHAAVVSGTLKAVLVYAEWAPLTDFSTYGLIEACGVLLNSTEFRLSSCEVLKHLVSRRKSADESPETLNAIIARIFEILSPVCEAYFQHLHAGGGDDCELAECLCLAFVSMGTQYMPYLASSEQRLALYFKLMLAFLQHPEFMIHLHALSLWLALLRDQSERKLSIETVATVLDVALQMVSKEDLEEESGIEYGVYRSRMTDLFRLSAHQHPSLGVTKVLQRVNLLLEVPPKAQDLSSFERTLSILDAVVSGVVSSRGFAESSELNSFMEGLLHRLLSVQWSEAELVELHGKFFDALCAYLRHVPSAVPLVVQKLFQLILSVPIAPKEENSANAKARVQICTSFLRVAIAAGTALLPHLEQMAESVTRLQREHRLLRGEQVSIGEAFLAAGATAGPAQQAQILEWLLGPFREHWAGTEWQQKYLSSPTAFIQLLCEGDKPLEDNRGMWFIYHSIALFEKSLRRSSGGSDKSHPMTAHIQWILPPLIQFLRCLHSLWSPSVLPTLPPHVQQAMQLSVMEQAHILGETPSRPADAKEDEFRNWLKGVRDNGYMILSLACMRLREPFFVSMAPLAGHLATALTENIASMEFRHLRQLILMVTNSVLKFCPRSQWSTWLGQLLPPVLLHCHATVPVAWESLVKTGSVKTSTVFAPSSELNSEVIEERMLRELTRDVCGLLYQLASSEIHTYAPPPPPQPSPQGQPPSHHPHQPSPQPPSHREERLLFFVSQFPEPALATVQMGIRSLQWPDTEAVHRGVMFCLGVLNLAVRTNDEGLKGIVSKEMFTAAIQSLTIECNGGVQSDLLSLLKDILLRLWDQTRQVLTTVPGMSVQQVEAFGEAFHKTASPKEQRVLIKGLLVAAGGEQLKALKPQKNSNVVTNVSRGSVRRERHQRHRHHRGGIEGSESFLGLVGTELSRDL